MSVVTHVCICMLMWIPEFFLLIMVSPLNPELSSSTNITSKLALGSPLFELWSVKIIGEIIFPTSFM